MALKDQFKLATAASLKEMEDDDFVGLLEEFLEIQEQDRMECNLKYYQPVSDKARAIHFSKAKIMGIGGGNGCLPLTAPVMMADETYKPLGEVVVGDMVMGADSATGIRTPSKVLTAWRSGSKAVYEVSFQPGYLDTPPFQATAEHMIPMYVERAGEVQKVAKRNRKLPPVKMMLGDHVSKIIPPIYGEPPRGHKVSFFMSIPTDAYGRNIRREAAVKQELIGFRECGDLEVDHPDHCYITSGGIMVSNSSKTETSLVELCMCATGVFPEWLIDALGPEGMSEKYMGPMKCRIIVKSLKNQLDTIMLNKLKWFQWTGLLPEGGDKGHWGWIPRKCLIGGSWEKSWMAGTSTLKFYSFDPVTDKPRGMSSIQFMSSDQEALAMAGNDLQFALLDEPSTLAIWRETQARVMRGSGRIFLAMTWPDDPSIPVDWIFDEIYDRAERDPSVEWVELSSFDNKNLDQKAVAMMAGRVSDEVRKVRYEGKPMRFSNLIHPGFTDSPSHWCFECCKETAAVPSDAGPTVCMECKGIDVVKYCHVTEFDHHSNWPTVFVLDPHPRKPHMWLHVQIDPNNDLWVVADGALAKEPADVAEVVTSVEEQMGLYVAQRIMDPNMGKQPCGKRREVSWQDEFAAGGLYCELADDSGVGRSRINERLKPDPDTYAPRLHIHPRCRDTIYQMKRYAWDEHRLSAERDQKQVPKPKFDDYPTMLKYLVNLAPNFRSLTPGQDRVLKTRIIRKR